MTLKQAIKRVWQDPSVIKEYIHGYFWYDIYKLNRRLVPERIRATAELRWFKLADRRCVLQGKCRACGCETAALFFAEKGCEANIWLGEEPCYSKMPTRKEWKEMKRKKNESI